MPWRTDPSTGDAAKQQFVDGKIYTISRLIWRMETGVDPGERQVDHRDGNHFNDKWINLRLATGQQNQFNHGVSSASSTGYRGVNKEYGRYRARAYGKKGKSLGVYDSPQEASAVYEKYCRRTRGQFHRRRS